MSDLLAQALKFEADWDAYMAADRHDANCHCSRCMVDFENWLAANPTPSLPGDDQLQLFLRLLEMDCDPDHRD